MKNTNLQAILSTVSRDYDKVNILIDKIDEILKSINFSEVGKSKSDDSTIKSDKWRKSILLLENNKELREFLGEVNEIIHELSYSELVRFLIHIYRSDKFLSNFLLYTDKIDFSDGVSMLLLPYIEGKKNIGVDDKVIGLGKIYDLNNWI